jgi:hypothetical protein
MDARAPVERRSPAMKTSPHSFRSIERIARSPAFGRLLVGGLVVIFWLAGTGWPDQVYRFTRSQLPAVVVAPR